MEPKITVNGTKMVIEVDLSNPGSPSASGKTLVVSSTHGNVKIMANGKEYLVGLNVCKRA